MRPTPTIREQEEGINGKLHVTPQTSGGIGKSYVSRILCEYFTNSRAYDLDGLSPTLHGIKVFQASVAPVIADGDRPTINVKAPFDWLRSKLVADEDAWDIVVDSPAWLNLSLREFLERSDVADLLLRQNRELWLHLIACGGSAQQATLADLDSLVQGWSGRAKILLWDNEYHGEVVDGADKTKRGLINTDTYRERWHDHVQGIVKLRRPEGFFRHAIEKVLADHTTFVQAIDDPDRSVTSKSRVFRVWSEIDRQLDAIYNTSAV